jgi:hypothetical protein
MEQLAALAVRYALIHLSPFPGLGRGTAKLARALTSPQLSNGSVRTRAGRVRSGGRDCGNAHLYTVYLRAFIAGGWFLYRALLILSATLAIYYSNLPWSGVRLVLAIAFTAFAFWAVWFAPERIIRAAAAATPFACGK